MTRALRQGMLDDVLSISATVDHQAQAARTKSALLGRPHVFLVQTMLAGAYIGLGVAFMTAAGGPFLAARSPATPLVNGLVFGVALTMVVIAGGELATSSMMYLTHGAMRRTIGWGRAGLVLLATLAGNLLGSMALGGLLHLSGLWRSGTAAGDMLAWMVEHKAAESAPELLVRGVLCNVLVCVAIWGANRLTSEGARIALIVGCIAVFVAAGFEHVVANMTTLSMGVYAGLPGASVAELARNVLWVGLGNTLGGAVLVGAAYAVGVPMPTAAPVADAAAPATAVAAAPAGGTATAVAAAPPAHDVTRVAAAAPVASGAARG